MNIEIKNLGVINKASFDLSKKLTVFCGQNSTGKTYASYIIYAMGSTILKANLKADGRLDPEHINAIFRNETISISINPDEVYQYRENLIGFIKQDIDNIFGISKQDRETVFGNVGISFVSMKEEYINQLFELSYENTFQIGRNKFKMSKGKNTFDVSITLDTGNKYEQDKTFGIYSDLIYTAIYRSMVLYPIWMAVIFPVERNSIYTFNKELSLSRNTLIDQMLGLSPNENIERFNLLEQGAKRYPNAIRDGLRIANDLLNIKKSNSKYFDIAQEIEDLLLGGKLDVSEEGDVVFYPNKGSNKGVKLQIHITASIVKTLASLVFYLKYIAVEGELVIIDEPEMNLHPDSQVVLVKILIELINKGLRLLISTHSDHIIREINNLITANSIVESGSELPEDYIWNEGLRLRKDDIDVYYFYHDQGDNVSVKPIAVEYDGFSIESMANAIEKQNDDSEGLYYKLI